MMALSDLAVFSEFLYTTMTEVVAQNIDLFNAATNDCLQLRSVKHIGDFSDAVMWAKLAGTIRRRDPYGTGALSNIHLTNLIDTMVRVGAGTQPIAMDPSQFRWIGMNPEQAGVIYGQQLAGDTLQEMVNTAIGCVDAALTGYATNTYDISGFTDPGTDTRLPLNPALASPTAFVGAAQKFGDRSAAIACWIMHSKVAGDLYVNALANHERLFDYGNVAVRSDPFGRRYIVSDIPVLVKTGSPVKYHTLGLTPGAVRIDQNDDYDANEDTRNGNENIARTFQAEWSYSIGIKGFSWDKGAGGKAPNNAALFSSANWDEIMTSNKDIAGVLLVSK